MNKDLITKRFILFIAATLLSFFVPWQITILILILAALLLPNPFEYIILVVGMFDGGIFSLVWFAVVAFGVFFREQVRFSVFSS